MTTKIPVKIRVIKPWNASKPYGGVLMCRIIHDLWVLSYVDPDDMSMHFVKIKHNWYAKRLKHKNPGVAFDGHIYDMKAVGVPSQGSADGFLWKINNEAGVINRNMFSSSKRLDIRLCGFGVALHGTLLIPLNKIHGIIVRNAAMFLDPFAIAKHPDKSLGMGDQLVIPWG